MEETRWRKYLTDAERARLEKIDAKIARAAASVSELKSEKQALANRCAQRARYAERKRPDGGE